MFRKKKKKDEKSNGQNLDKIIMGAVIGGAIGSVLGATIAPKEGKKTRKEIKKAAKQAKNTTEVLYKKVKNMINEKRKKREQETVRKIPNEMEK